MEPWMTGALNDLPPVQAALLYSLEHARMDVGRWTAEVAQEALWVRTGDVAPAAFHIRHIAGSIDRLLTYAEGRQLTEQQMEDLRAEQHGPELAKAELLEAFEAKLRSADERVRRLDVSDLHVIREIGRKRIPVPLGVLLVHIAEHTQRHVGALIVTLKSARSLIGPS